MVTSRTEGTDVSVGTAAIRERKPVHKHMLRIAIDPNPDVEEQAWLEDENGNRLPAKTKEEMYPQHKYVKLEVAVPIMLLQHTASPTSCCMKFGNTWYPICP